MLVWESASEDLITQIKPISGKWGNGCVDSKGKLLRTVIPIGKSNGTCLQI